MDFYKPLRITLFIYEGIRFMAFALLSRLVFQSTQQWIWTCPNILFTLMALFLMLDFWKYKEFVQLFIAGKSLYVFLSLLFFVRGINSTIMVDPSGSIGQGINILTTFFDLFSIIACLFIRKKLRITELKHGIDLAKSSAESTNTYAEDGGE